MTAAEKLLIIRKHLKLTQSAMASMLGIKQAYYSELERGEKEIGTKVLKLLFEAGKVNEEWFFSDKGAILNTANGNNPTERINVNIIEFAVMQKNLLAALKEKPEVEELYNAAIDIASFQHEYDLFCKKYLALWVDYSSTDKIDVVSNLNTLYVSLEKLMPIKKSLLNLAQAIKEFNAEIYKSGDKDFATSQIENILGKL